MKRYNCPLSTSVLMPSFPGSYDWRRFAPRPLGSPGLTTPWVPVSQRHEVLLPSRGFAPATFSVSIPFMYFSAWKLLFPRLDVIFSKKPALTHFGTQGANFSPLDTHRSKSPSSQVPESVCVCCPSGLWAGISIHHKAMPSTSFSIYIMGKTECLLNGWVDRGTSPFA